MKFYRKHCITKSLGLSLAIVCWLCAAAQFCSGLKTHGVKIINAFIETTDTGYNSKNNLVSIKNITRTTSEIILPSITDNQAQALNMTTTFLKNYDKNLTLVLGQDASNYHDYYFYSPLLSKDYGIKPLSQGFNIHLAITDSPVHIYIGVPYIDYDF